MGQLDIMALDMAINTQNANSYFKGRTIGAIWDRYSGNQKNAAILQARRELARAIGRELKDEEPPYKEGDRRRDEYAVYEQAYFDLCKDALPEGTGDTTPSLVGNYENVPVPDAVAGQWSKDALMWLCDELRVNVIR